MNQVQLGIWLGLGGFIALWLIIWLIIKASTKASHKNVDNKNARIKAAGGNKRKLSERFGDDEK